MGGYLAPFGTGIYALDWLWAVVVRDWSTKISLATPLGAIIEVTHVGRCPAFPLCSSPCLSAHRTFHWTAAKILSKNCQSIWQLIRFQRRINYRNRRRTWLFLLQILRFETRSSEAQEQSLQLFEPLHVGCILEHMTQVGPFRGLAPVHM